MSTTPIGLDLSSALNTPAQPAASSSISAAAQSSVNALGDPTTFLQLLVAQLKYQDPESPADGTQFVTQLATFAGVEQQSQMRSDLDAIDQVAQKYAAGPAPASTAGTPGTSN